MADYLYMSPAWGTTVTKKCPVVITNFGDGYLQKSALPPVKEIQATFKGLSNQSAYSLKQFFESCRGIEPFYWRVLDTHGWELFYVEQWNEQIIGSDISNITATFLGQTPGGSEGFDVGLPPQTLSLIPSYSTPVSRQFNMRKIQFGQGWIERGVDGINGAKTTWDIKVNGLDNTTAQALNVFLTQRRGVAPFYWSEYGGTDTSLYTCEEWSFDLIGENVQNFSAQFVQFFGFL